MTRPLFRIAMLALATSALAGCSAMSAVTASSAPPPPKPAAEAPVAALDLASMIAQAQTQRLAGDFAGSTRMLSQLMLAYPDDARVVGEYGKLLVQEGHAQDGVDFLHRAIELSANDWSLYSALGVAYDQLGDRKNARDAYEHGLALNSKEPALFNNYAMSRMLAGDTAGARTLMARAQALGGNDPRIAENLARLNPAGPVAAPAPGFPAAAAPVQVAGKPSGPVASVKPGAPTPIATHAPSNVVMQAVPADPLAGPVKKRTKVAKAPKKPEHVAAASGTAKPVAPATAAKPDPRHEIPALRMTADASKP